MKIKGPRFFSICGFLTVLGVLAGCATPRPTPGIACNLYTQHGGSRTLAPVPPAGADVRLPRSLLTWDRNVSLQALSLRSQIEQNAKDRQDVKRELRRIKAQPAPPEPLSYEVLVLSAGGQFGAYGSGFLKGWGERNDLQPNRANIDMITGVSTGAMMATYAYLGSSDDSVVRAKYDALLKEQYTTLRNENVFRPRSAIEFLWANSVYDSAPLRTRIGGLITDELLQDVIAEEQRSKRLLFVGAVNADNGQFEHFDLVAVANDPTHDRKACYASAILASAAIPVAFEPMFINGSMYIDGGARQHVFFLTQAAAALTGTSKNLYGLLHGDLNVPRQITKNNLIGVLSRTSSIATDQLLLDSAYFVDAEAKRLGYHVQWSAAANTHCTAAANDDMFDPALGICLWETGLARARDETNPWKALADVGAP